MSRFAIIWYLGLLALLPSCHSIKDNFHRTSLPMSSFRGPLPRLQLASLLKNPRYSANQEIQALKNIQRSGVSLDGSFLTPRDQDAISLRLAVLESRLGLMQKSESALWRIRKTTKNPWVHSLAQALQAWCLLEGGKLQKAHFVLAKIPSIEKARLEPLISQMTRRLKLNLPTSPHSQAKAISPNFRILPRAAWKNRPAIPGKMVPMGSPTRITIHHTAMETPKTPEEATQQIRLIQRNQIQKKGWGDIGYHFLIDPWGRIFEGRQLKFQGAHAGDNKTNKHNIGICLQGNFQEGQAGASHPTPAQIRAMQALVWVLSDTFRIPPSQVFSHQEIRPTATFCPGTWLIPEIQKLKQNLAIHRAMQQKKGLSKSLSSFGGQSLGG